VYDNFPFIVFHGDLAHWWQDFFSYLGIPDEKIPTAKQTCIQNLIDLSIKVNPPDLQPYLPYFEL